MSFRIGTWNLDRSGIRKTERLSRQRELIKGLKADVMVLTETHDNVALPGYAAVSSSIDPDYHEAGESCSAIWSLLPLRRIPTADPIATVCAELESPFGPMLVYGTIITYADDGVREGTAKKWERHRQAVQQQTKDWQRLRERYPHHMLCVAGDFNMNLDRRHWYGVKDAKETVLRGLDAVGMFCATTADLQSPPYSLSRSTVDHICLPTSLKAGCSLEVWEGDDLSDHNGVLVNMEH